MAILAESDAYNGQIHHGGHAPFVRFLIALTVGIGIGCAMVPTWPLYLAAWGALVIVVSVFITIRCITRLRQHRYYNTLGVLVLLAWSIIGCLLTWQTDPAINRTHFSRVESKALVGLVADEPVLRGNHIRFPLAITHAYGDTGAQNVTGTLMLTVRVSDSLVPEQLSYGDELLIPSGYETVAPPYNPGELDYRSYLAGKNIWHQDYLGSHELKKLGGGKGSPFITYALAIRQRMVAKFAEYIPDRDAYSVASALILGYRAEMSDRLVQAFSNTGTIHVLSVSGMHVVLVFWLLAKLLWWMDRSKGLRVAKFMILLLAVWGYALLTGFSPPVLRASIMVSFVMAATIFGQQNRIYNSIAASAFFLLLYEPKFIVDIGFQLSYLAVLGIVYLHPVMRAFFPTSNRLVRPVTDYIGMSIGAQAGAGPLAAYYFHQFPLYFLPANLFVVLPTSAIMYVGFALLILPAGNLARWTGAVLEKLILATNTTLGWIEQWPMASIRGIWTTWWESLLVYMLITVVAMAIMVRRKQWVYGALVCVAFLVCTSFFAALSNTGPQVIVFNVRRNLAIGLVDRGEAWLYTNLSSIDDRSIGYSVLPALEAHASVDDIHFMVRDSSYRDQQVYAKGDVLQFGDTRFMVYDGTNTYGGHMEVDVVILRNNPEGSLATLLEAVDCKQLLLDGSNYHSTIDRWKAEANAVALPVYVLKDNFAYVWPLESRVP
ncbi:ComEC/Rec2 family competence protein [Parapedobacter sp. 10938]|uniref:ComEC/Rec2 family competence protein n=1 Tax=Parapedobacter flavus TaxID=3110225 RepID=UPI002DB6FF68|nr:ComEC/Rec2 family competence protein [Parapedobacter sp. 10938]MEC3881366.1 ComEC/Rec2 family competence protein [Parapedobacter sp. 10938]